MTVPRETKLHIYKNPSEHFSKLASVPSCFSLHFVVDFVCRVRPVRERKLKPSERRRKFVGVPCCFSIIFRGGFCLQSAAHERTEAQGYAQRLQKRYVVLSCFHTVSSRDRSALQPRRKERSSAQYFGIDPAVDNLREFVWNIGNIG